MANVMEADRKNEGKTQWSLVDFNSFEDMARVLEFGAQKYSRDNWKLGMPITKLCDSLMRHLIDFMSGQDFDLESGLSLIGHMQCNLMFMAYVMKHKKEQFDDRHIIEKTKITEPSGSVRVRTGF